MGSVALPCLERKSGVSGQGGWKTWLSPKFALSSPDPRLTLHTLCQMLTTDRKLNPDPGQPISPAHLQDRPVHPRLCGNERLGAIS